MKKHSVRKIKKRKPRPSPPKSYFYINDDCWWCENTSGCNSCHIIKEYRRNYRDKKAKQKNKEIDDYLNK